MRRSCAAEVRSVIAVKNAQSIAGADYIEGMTPADAVALKASKGVAPVRPRGARIIVLGDSIDAAPNGWFPYLCILSSQKVTYQRSAGIGGNTTSNMLARIQSDVIVYAPDICIIGGATNDHNQGVPEATTRANYAAMVSALRAAGIAVLVRRTPPCDVAANTGSWNSVASRRAVIQRHNAWITRWATDRGIPVVDIYTPLVDPATGGLRAAVAGDGTHPSEQGYKDMATGILAAGLPSIFVGKVFLSSTKADGATANSNPVFIGDSNADGGADG